MNKIFKLTGLVCLFAGLAAHAQRHDRSDDRPQGPGRWQSKIQIINATYGGNCGAYGNATNDVSMVCNRNQNSSCTYTISESRLGDPCYGTKKDFNVDYSCEGRNVSVSVPREASGKSITLSCNGSGGGGYPQSIQVLSASYGRNVGARENNAYNDLAQSCNYQRVCNYRVSVRNLGDPAYGQRKDFRVSYQCGNGQQKYASLAPEADGRTLTLDCR